jgi:hypothetical protein
VALARRPAFLLEESGFSAAAPVPPGRAHQDLSAGLERLP